MKSVYERTNLIITKFDTEDMIATSGTAPEPTEPIAVLREKENAYGSFNSFDQTPGSWF